MELNDCDAGFFPAFNPQWTERAMEAADVAEEFGLEGNDVLLATQMCRLCACTNYSACDGGCEWVGGDLCSLCEELMEAWAVLRLADGYGIAASWAFETELSRWRL